MELLASPRHLIVLMHRNHARAAGELFCTLSSVLGGQSDVHWLLIDDASTESQRLQLAQAIPPMMEGRLRVIWNTDHQGMGGSQKVGFRYAIQNKFDDVTVVRIGKSYDFGVIPALWNSLRENPVVGCVLGVPDRRRFLAAWMTGPGRMVWAWLQNRIAQTRNLGWSSRYRVFRTSEVQRVAFELNTNEAYFEIELLLQYLQARIPIHELSVSSAAIRQIVFSPSPAYQAKALKAAIRYRLQKLNLFYDFRFHPEYLGVAQPMPNQFAERYRQKLDISSPHSFVCENLDLIPEGSRVLDIGCSTGYIAERLIQRRRCRVVGVDLLPASRVVSDQFEYHQMDLEKDLDDLCQLIENGNFDVVLMLDVLEHLALPEKFLLRLYRIPYPKRPLYIFSTGNVAFFVVRLMLFTGYFNYGEKGILDITHKRLFTWRTFQNLFDQTGFSIRRKISFPAPYAMMGFPSGLSWAFTSLNEGLLRLRPSLFAYQIMVVATPFTTPEQQLHDGPATNANR